MRGFRARQLASVDLSWKLDNIDTKFSLSEENDFSHFLSYDFSDIQMKN